MNWRPELDALIASPEHHSLLFENDHVRVLDVRIEPGETTAVHTHCWPGVLHIVSRSDFVRRSDKGEITLDTRGMPQSDQDIVWTDPLSPHSLENVGDRSIHIIAVEIKPK